MIHVLRDVLMVLPCTSSSLSTLTYTLRSRDKRARKTRIRGQSQQCWLPGRALIHGMEWNGME
jgi:hypothetical protein